MSGQGDGIFMEMPNDTTFFIDGGSTDVKSLSEYRLEPFFKSKGIYIVDYWIVTHCDNDHISGLKEMMEQMDLVKEEKNDFISRLFHGYKNKIVIKHLVLPNTNLKDDAYLGLVSMALSKHIPVLYIETDDYFVEGEASITCLHPDKDFITDSRNGYSTVLSLHYKEFDLLLTGDLEEQGENQLMKTLEDIKEVNKFTPQPVAVDYDVLKVAHHGSKYSTSSLFLKLIHPEYSIISCGLDNSYGHPDEELLDRLKEINSNIWITTKRGAISIVTDGEKMKVEGISILE